MRSREDITSSITNPSIYQGDVAIAHNQGLILEVLLDIRDLLSEKGQTVSIKAVIDDYTPPDKLQEKLLNATKLALRESKKPWLIKTSESQEVAP